MQTRAAPGGLSPLTLERTVEPEWLDHLPPDDPRAVRSRRDLRVVNRIMGHSRIIRRVLEEHVDTDAPRLAEIGAGDGTQMLAVLEKLPPRKQGTISIVDMQPLVSDTVLKRYAKRGYTAAIETADVFDWLARQHDTYDAIVANLFVHHFEAPRLITLFALAARCTKLFIACEPWRSRLPLVGSRLLGLIGCNDVTRHDAYLSVKAGFASTELSELWPRGDEWTLRERRAGVLSHLFVAARSA